jgi:hypothetical protein
MKLLLDECVTRYIKHDLIGHEVDTVDEAGLKGLQNDELLRSAVGLYDVLITVDRHLPYQQNISTLGIAILILAAQGNTYAHLRVLMPQALKALESIGKGEVVTITQI